MKQLFKNIRRNIGTFIDCLNIELDLCYKYNYDLSGLKLKDTMKHSPEESISQTLKVAERHDLHWN